MRDTNQKAQMRDTNVQVATSSDKDAVIRVIVRAFESDPMARWCWPNSSNYAQSMEAFARAIGGRAFDCDGAHWMADHSGAALWLSPETQPDQDAVVSVIEASVAESARGHIYGVLEQMARFHPSEPHWYLPLIGVDPQFQGKGCGSALLSFATARFDDEKRVAYLESTNPRNLSLYERYSFEQIGNIQVGTSPTIVPMIRKPK